MQIKKPYKRDARVGPLIHRKLNEMLARGMVELSLPKAHITLSTVDVSPDFAQAKVYFSVLDRSMAAEVAGCLNDMAALFQRELAGSLQLRRIPRLIFAIDESMIAASRIDELLADQ